jgi:molybdopterin-containing oxidoreductase family membrane subunit
VETKAAPDKDELLFDSVLKTGKGFYALFCLMLGLFLWGVYGYSTQLRYGLGVTGLNRTNFWGFYIVNFVFFIGISHAGTLISAILRLCQAEWRRPITRMAETITVMVICYGAANVVVDLGRPDRFLYVFRYGRIQSPMIWDVISICTYLTASSVYLYVALIPDIALLRDIVRPGLRKSFYALLSLGWTGTAKQRRRLDIAIAILAVMVIPIAVSVHTVVSWVFGMTIQPMWHSTIFGPYFVVGAIYSGIAALLIAMAILRKAYRLEGYIKPLHFDYLGRLFLAMCLLWFYFTLAEFITTYYGHEPTEMAAWWDKISGRYAVFFWTMVVTNVFIPFTILCNKRTRTVAGTVTASVFVLIGMWLERFVIVAPTLANPRLPWGHGSYMPTWVECSELAAMTSGFVLFYMVFVKLFPVISIWEVREGRERSVQEVVERVKNYMPMVA